MAGEVRLDDPQVLHGFAGEVTRARSRLVAIGGAEHAGAMLHPPGPAWPLADVSRQAGALFMANEAAIGRLAGWATDADRGLSGLAFVATWVATNFPATDRAGAEGLGDLVRRGEDAVPPLPADRPLIDRRFQSPVREA